jgi:predicted DNA binding protein
MPTVIRAEVPCSEFALSDTLTSLPDASFECERIVETGEDVILPLIWAYGVERDALEDCLASDPSVADVSLLAAFDDEYLYRMEWIEQVRLVVQMLTSAKATVLDCYGDGETWTLRVLFPDRESLSATTEFCEEQGLTMDVHYVREMDREPAGRFGLTAKQYDALTTACERGYFEVPRETELRELADEFGVSHQTLSERLRRGYEVLIQETLLVGPPPEQS